jgi:hypothetical protein
LDSTKVMVAEEGSITVPCLMVMRKPNAEKKEMSILLPQARPQFSKFPHSAALLAENSALVIFSVDSQSLST